MKTKEIYKITFSGLYATATLKAEIEPHPHLVKLDQVGKDISNFSGYWYFHVWVEAKSKKTAIRKGAVQIMNYLETEGCKVISAVTLSTMETLLEQKAVWEVLKAEEEAKEDTAPEDEAPFGDPQSDASSDVPPKEEKDPDEVDCHNGMEVCEGWKVSLTPEQHLFFKADKNSDYHFPLNLYEVERTDECPVYYKDQFEIDRENGPSDFTLNIYVKSKELGLVAGRDDAFKEAAVRAAFIKLKWKLKNLTQLMGSSISEKGEWSTFKFEVGDAVYLLRAGEQYTTYYSLFGDLVARAYNETFWNDFFAPTSFRQGKSFKTPGTRSYAKFKVIAREEVWEPTLNRMSNIYLVELLETCGAANFNEEHMMGDLHLIREEGLSKEETAIES